MEYTEITTKLLLEYLKGYVEKDDTVLSSRFSSEKDTFPEHKLWGYSFEENCTGFFYDIPSPFCSYKSWSSNYEDRKHNFMVYCELQRDMHKLLNTIIEIEEGNFKGWFLYLIKDSKNLPQVCLCEKRPIINTGWWSSIVNFFSAYTKN